MSEQGKPMQRASDFDREVLDLFNDFIHGHLDRRGFLSQAARYAVGGVTATMLLDALSPNYARAQVVKPEDARLVTRLVDVPSPQGHGTIRGYLARPAHASGKLPGIVVIHENRGLTPHIEDIARRLALEGHVAFAPDGLTSMGGYSTDEDKTREAFNKIDKPKMYNDFLAAAQALRGMAECNGKLGATGFCFGGSVVNFLAARLPELRAGAPFYGNPLTAAETASVKAALLIHHAGNDKRLMTSLPAFEKALQDAQVRHAIHVYPNVEHGFHNDTTPRYDAAAAKLAWTRTLEFFKANLA